MGAHMGGNEPKNIGHILAHVSMSINFFHSLPTTLDLFYTDSFGVDEFILNTSFFTRIHW